MSVLLDALKKAALEKAALDKQKREQAAASAVGVNAAQRLFTLAPPAPSVPSPTLASPTLPLPTPASPESVATVPPEPGDLAVVQAAPQPAAEQIEILIDIDLVELEKTLERGDEAGGLVLEHAADKSDELDLASIEVTEHDAGAVTAEGETESELSAEFVALEKQAPTREATQQDEPATASLSLAPVEPVAEENRPAHNKVSKSAPASSEGVIPAAQFPSEAVSEPVIPEPKAEQTEAEPASDLPSAPDEAARQAEITSLRRKAYFQTLLASNRKIVRRKRKKFILTFAVLAVLSTFFPAFYYFQVIQSRPAVVALPPSHDSPEEEATGHAYEESIDDPELLAAAGEMPVEGAISGAVSGDVSDDFSDDIAGEPSAAAAADASADMAISEPAQATRVSAPLAPARSVKLVELAPSTAAKVNQPKAAQALTSKPAQAVSSKPAQAVTSNPAQAVTSNSAQAVASKPANRSPSARQPIEIISGAARIDPLSEAINTAYAAFQTGDYSTAQTHYQRALSLDAHNRDALLGAAAVALTQQRYKEALDLYQRQLARNPQDDYAHAGLLSIAAADSASAEIFSRVGNLLTTWPEAAHLHFLHGALLAKTGQWVPAQTAFFNAWSRDPARAAYAYNLAIALDHLDQPQEALRFYRQLLSLPSADAALFDIEAVQRRIAQLEARN